MRRLVAVFVSLFLAFSGLVVASPALAVDGEAKDVFAAYGRSLKEFLKKGAVAGVSALFAQLLDSAYQSLSRSKKTS